MIPPTPRALTFSRIVALALVAAVIAGLCYLRFGTGSDPVTVPEGAQSGDLILERGTYATEDGAYDADRGTIVVPENRADPRSRLIALPVVRIKARSASPAEPIFWLYGGPGHTNMQFPYASRYAENHDVVIVGYRGVDGSARLDCPEVVSALKHSTDFLGEKSFRAYANGFRSCADRLTDDGFDLAGYTLAQRVDDFEAARAALGYDRINLLSESAGTRTALVYSWRHPQSINRSVMIGVNPPGGHLWDPKTTDEQLARYAAHCAADANCSGRTDDLAVSMRRTASEIPDRWLFLPIKRGSVPLASFFGLHESTIENAPLSAPMTLDAWLAASEGDASGFWLLSLLSDLAFPTSFVWGEMAAYGSGDTDAVRRYFSSTRGRDSILGNAGTRFIWADGRLADAWPTSPGAREYSRVRTSNVETLMISGELDLATPPQSARKLLPYLPNGEHVLLDGFAHTLDFFTYQPEAGSRLVTTYLESGRVDRSLYEPQVVDFTPEVTDPALAKGIAGTMLGLAILTVVSLLWLAVRVHRRGRLRRKPGAAVRSVYAVVLGLGGWFFGVLVVITTTPGVPLDHEPLAVSSIGLPVGIAIYLAWVHRDSPRRTNAAGFAASLAGALVGAALGFHASADLLALVTAIVGAVAGANVTLILST